MSKIDAIYALYPESFCDKNLAIRKVFIFVTLVVTEKGRCFKIIAGEMGNHDGLFIFSDLILSVKVAARGELQFQDLVAGQLLFWADLRKVDASLVCHLCV